MTVIAVIAGIIFPRIVAVLLYFNSWFNNCFEGILWPLIGFLLMSRTMLWLSYIISIYQNYWGWWQWTVLVFAVLADLEKYEAKATTVSSDSSV